MKKFTLLTLVVLALLFTACGSNESNRSGTHPTATMPNPKPPLPNLMYIYNLWHDYIMNGANFPAGPGWDWRFNWDEYENNIYPIDLVSLPPVVAEAAKDCQAEYVQIADEQHTNIFCFYILGTPEFTRFTQLNKNGFWDQDWYNAYDLDGVYVYTHFDPVDYVDPETAIRYLFGLPHNYPGELPHLGVIKPEDMEAVVFAPDVYLKTIAGFIADASSLEVLPSQLTAIKKTYDDGSIWVMAFEAKIGDTYYYYPIHITAAQALTHDSNFTCSDRDYDYFSVCYGPFPYTPD